MKFLKLTAAACVAGIGISSYAATTQVGDFRLNSNAYSVDTAFDIASPGDTTRSVLGAPVAINSNFIAVTQNPGGTPDPATDIRLKTFSSVTNIININRYASDPDGPGVSGGPQRVGAVQWSFDLTPLDTYLSNNALVLTALDLSLLTTVGSNATDKPYDVYLSYTNAGESITLASLSTSANSGDDNYDNFWFPARAAAEGDVVNGTHKLIEKDVLDALNLESSILSLYDSGVRDFNLIVSSGAFFSGRIISITEGSGLSIDTAPIPEPSSLALLGLGGLLIARRRR